MSLYTASIVGKRCKELEHVGLSSCANMGKAALGSLLVDDYTNEDQPLCKSLKSVDLSFCEQVDDAVIELLCEKVTKHAACSKAVLVHTHI